VRGVDPDEYRRAALEQWERSAGGWGRRASRLQELTAPVSHWMVEAIAPQPGHTVLELAAGPGETGFLAAELVAPGGTLICSDFAEPMLEAARGRARELGLDNVDFRRIDAESIDLDTASVDGVLCRWGYMLVADPAAALQESRRVLRPGGRLAMAAWAGPERNPWVAEVADEVRTRLDLPQPDPTQPGMFALAAPGRLEELLSEAGFADVVVEPLDLVFRYGSFEELWELTLELSVPLADALEPRQPAEREALREAVRERLAPLIGADGTLSVPARPLLAAAGA
jgi:SAM-dependent methyltransferase